MTYLDTDIRKLTGWPKELGATDILLSMPDAIFLTDSQMRIVFFNLAAEKITEFRSFEAQGMYCKDVLKTSICETECVVKRALDADQNIFNIETTITTANGKTIPALVSASLIKNKEGRIIGYLYSFRDISLLKKIMTDLEISRMELTERNVELHEALKELKLTHEQLLQAQKMEALGTLAGGVAHDFNNILTGILGFASLAKTEISTSSPVYKYMEHIEKSVIRASELTSKILTFARRSFFEIKTVDLNRLIIDISQILERTTKRSINIKNDLTSFLCYVDIDESKMEQAIMNICINAIEAMPDGGTLTIKTEVINPEFNIFNDYFHQSQQQEYVKLSIIDNGIGMDEETRSRIFDPFFTTKGKTGGTGLGLAMVYGIIKEFNGHIEVESKIGFGTQFHCFLPLSKECKQRLISIDKEVAIDIPKGAGETILLVDDDKMILEMGNNILKHLRYKVLLAEDGLTALELYKEKQKEIDVVVLDLIMPKLSGKEVFDRIRLIDPYAKIIFSTGYAKEEMLQPLSDRQANGFLKKPYKIKEMAECIQHVIKMKRGDTTRNL
ncbi:MAG: response regulator [Nitrospirae bacterium]|nr:response regulator [Nitrospirota bacterium]